jgi:hypothetical protein
MFRFLIAGTALALVIATRAAWAQGDEGPWKKATLEALHAAELKDYAKRNTSGRRISAWAPH